MISMEHTQTTPTMPIAYPETPVEALPTVSPPPPTPTIAKKSLPIVAILGSVILVLIITLMTVFLQNRRTNAPAEQVTVTPTTAPTPTPIRKRSALSNTDAFSSFSAKNASFSAEINAFTFQEGLFTPPTLDLDLGIND